MMTRFRTLTITLLTSAIVLTTVGIAQCQDPADVPKLESSKESPRRGSDLDGSSFELAKIDYAMMIVINVNSDFQDRMERDDAAFKHIFSIIETFNRDTVGAEARLIVTQTGGRSTDPLLWEGSPRQIRQQFAKPDDFREFIQRKLFQGPPNAIEGLVKSTKYLLNHEALDNVKCRPAVFIISDALDSRPYEETFKDCAALAKNFVALAGRGGVCGWYFVDHRNLDWAKEIVQRSGFRDFRVEAEVVRRPTVPRFK